MYVCIYIYTHLYKLFTKMITNKVKKQLELYQPTERIGFRSGFGTNDYLFSLKALIEKTINIFDR